ncbi:hypothetical protein WJX74_009255 [Apatococcus lobatus]|uniref:Uncharacterized protein n=1 Tax=Apatococcus lobatus TaxID=904363 RepID=A0AAW1R0F4_9CHLO
MSWSLLPVELRATIASKTHCDLDAARLHLADRLKSPANGCLFSQQRGGNDRLFLDCLGRLLAQVQSERDSCGTTLALWIMPNEPLTVALYSRAYHIARCDPASPGQLCITHEASGLAWNAPSAAGIMHLFEGVCRRTVLRISTNRAGILSFIYHDNDARRWSLYSPHNGYAGNS